MKHIYAHPHSWRKTRGHPISKKCSKIWRIKNAHIGSLGQIPQSAWTSMLKPTTILCSTSVDYTSIVALTMVPSHWNQLNTCSTVVHKLNMWRYAANIIWQLFVNKRNLGLRISFSKMQCLFDQPLCKTCRQFNRIWFILRSGFSWTIWRQRNDVIFNKVQWSVEKTPRGALLTILCVNTCVKGVFKWGHYIIGIFEVYSGIL